MHVFCNFRTQNHSRKPLASRKKVEIELLNQLLFFIVFYHLLYPKLFWQSLIISVKHSIRIFQYEDGWCDAVSAQHICKSDVTDSSWPPQWEVSVIGSQPWQVSVAEAGTRNNSVTALHGLKSMFFLLWQCVTFAAHLTPNSESGFCSVFSLLDCFILKSLLIALNRAVIPSFKENDNCSDLGLPK